MIIEVDWFDWYAGPNVIAVSESDFETIKETWEKYSKYPVLKEGEDGLFRIETPLKLVDITSDIQSGKANKYPFIESDN